MTEAAITAETTVNEAVLRVPASLAVFSACGIDACCGGSLAIGEAARRHGLDANALLERLREGGGGRDAGPGASPVAAYRQGRVGHSSPPGAPAGV